MKRVLIVTYWYPPNQSIAALRLSKFAKYLPDFGWEPIVVTVEPASDLYQQAGPLPDEMRLGRVYRTRDYSLGVWAYKALQVFRRLRGLSASSPPVTFYGSRNLIIRAAYGLYRHGLCFPDECWPWQLEYPVLRRVVEREQPDLLFSSSLPATAHLIAHRLAKEYRLPWVADLRDLWSHSYTLQRPPLLRQMDERLEQRTLQLASALTTVSEPLRAHLMRLHGKPTYVVMNGFDETDQPLASEPGPTSPRKFSWVYTGTVYAGKQDPTPLFRALQALTQQGLLRPEEWQVTFYGRNTAPVAQTLRQFPELHPNVVLSGEISHAQALQAQRTATALLFLEWQDPHHPGVLTGKIFEYLAAGRPILACGPQGGAVERLLQETGAGVLAASATEVQTILLRWLDEFRCQGTVSGTIAPETLIPYSRRYQTGQLAEVLDHVAPATRS